MKVDTLIKNGFIVDGTGKEGTYGLVAMKDNKILLPRDEDDVVAKEIIDATGSIVSPGFIDIHTHSDLTLLIDSRGASKLSQGVTTEIIGNCGIAPTPCPPSRKEYIMESGTLLYAEKIDWGWEDYADYLQRFADGNVSMNIGFYIGHGAIRASVMGFDDRAPTKKEMDQMKKYVAEGMELGAVGLSTGLGYAPGMYADVDEIAELCKVVVDYGGIYSTHIRNEGDQLIESIDEAIAVSRKSRVPLQISHLKAVGKQNWGKVITAIAHLEDARKEGIDAHYDFYPYTASSTTLSSQLPNWAHEGGWEKLAERLTNPETKKKMIDSVLYTIEESVGWQSILIASVRSKDLKQYEGKNLDEISKQMNIPPAEAMIHLLYEDKGFVRMIKFSMSDEDVNTVASGKLSMVGSDGYAIATDGPLSSGKPHPRSYGTFPRIFKKYQREEQLFTVEEAVFKMTGSSAQKLKFNKRGFIKDGYYADITIFKPENMDDISSYTEPHQYSKGVEYVFVNGKKAYDGRSFLNPKSGVLLKPYS
ncbi:amidohydrolase family protein [Evansella sp. AB-rgal1]|uniref:N-acyl-D-amino-acid deacylase family protein n=1 Tax=Evansella sp. AB-rgal1 TaxID=3242696 RepID=UPI00359DA511